MFTLTIIFSVLWFILVLTYVSLAISYEVREHKKLSEKTTVENKENK